MISKIPFIGDANSGRKTLESADDDEIEEAIEHLDRWGEDKTKENIERVLNIESGDDEEPVNSLESKSQRGANDRRLVAAAETEEHADHLVRDSDYVRLLGVHSFGDTIPYGNFIDFVWGRDHIRVSVDIQPIDKSSLQTQLKRKSKTLDTEARTSNRAQSQEAGIHLEDVDEILAGLMRDNIEMVGLTLTIEVMADSKSKLDERTRSIQDELKQKGMEATPIFDRQRDVQEWMLPLNSGVDRPLQIVKAEVAAALIMAVGPAINQPGGVYFGLDHFGRPVIASRFDGHSGHAMAISGKVGSGKTYHKKMTLYFRLLFEPDFRSIIFDPLGDDFVDFAEKVGGDVIRFGGDQRINPMAIEPPSEGLDSVRKGQRSNLYRQKKRSVLEMLKTHFSHNESMDAGLDEEQEGLLGHAIDFAYGKYGITTNPETFASQNPILDDIFQGIDIIATGGLDDYDGDLDENDVQRIQESAPDRARDIVEDPPKKYQEIAQNLLPKFESFREGSINDNLNGRTNIDLDSNVLCFDMSSFADTGDEPLIMHAMLDWAYQEARRYEHEIDVTFEEAHYLLGNEHSRDLINLFIRHGRHFNAGLTLITQTAEEFLGMEAKREIYDNCDIKLLFYQESIGNEVVDYFNLSQAEESQIQTLARGETNQYSECLFHSSEFGRRFLTVRPFRYQHHVCVEDLNPLAFIEGVCECGVCQASS